MKRIIVSGLIATFTILSVVDTADALFRRRRGRCCQPVQNCQPAYYPADANAMGYEGAPQYGQAYYRGEPTPGRPAAPGAVNAQGTFQDSPQFQGSTTIQGPNGTLQGTTGAQGSTGTLQGTTGVQGSTGTQGASGSLQGSTGIQSSTGSQGTSGSIRGSTSTQGTVTTPTNNTSRPTTTPLPD